MSYFEILRQHQFIRFLRKNDILTPKIYLNVFLSAFKVELQEYIFESKRKKRKKK